MNLGMMNGYDPARHDYYVELGITHFGVGVANPLDEFPITLATTKMIEAAGFKTYLHWHCSMEEANSPDFLTITDNSMRAIAKEMPQDLIEILPEPCCPFVTGSKLTFAQYVALLKCAYLAVKDVRPEMRVVNGGIGQFRTLWGIDYFIEHGLAYTDMLNVHPFQFADSWAAVANRVGALLAEAKIKMETLGSNKGIICTEWGFPTSPRKEVYTSSIDPRGVRGFLEEDAAKVMQSVLADFIDFESELFCFAMMQDIESPHWGGRTGTLNVDGSKKLTHDATVAWLQENRDCKGGFKSLIL